MTPCECRDHRTPCVPVPSQSERYAVRVGEGDAGRLKVCSSCYVNGHMWFTAWKFQDQERQRVALERAAREFA